MFVKNFFVVILILSFCTLAHAQANLEQINYSNLTNDRYKVTLILDKQISFEVIHTIDKVALTLSNTNYNVKTLANKLDGRFIRNIRKSTNKLNDLRVIFELSNDIKFIRSYFSIKEEHIAITIEFKSNIPLKILELNNKYTIMIDPGHGGIDNGTIGTNKTLEKNLALSYARELKKELSKYPQYKILMTRDQDIYLSIEERKQKAQKMKADLFISIHADFHEDSNMHGASIYTLSHEAMDKESLALSERENKADILKNDTILKENKDIADVLIDMVYHDTKNSSINLAKITTEELNKEVQMLQKSHRSAGLKILKGVDIPAILIELGYLSNNNEEKLLNSYRYRKLFIKTLAQGINKYTNNIEKK